MSGKTCHVYLIAHKKPDGTYVSPVKIGITHSVNARLRTLQTGNPAPLGVAFVFSTPDMHFAKVFESALHARNAERRLSGEWFDMPPREALLSMVMAFWVILKHELGEDADLWEEAMEACGANGAMKLLADHHGDLVH